jgi:hypothetical protein
MALLHLHHHDVRSVSREARLTLRQVARWTGCGFRTIHQAIIRAKLRRLRTEVLLRPDYDEMFASEHDAGKFPQRPLILGDKWDF